MRICLFGAAGKVGSVLGPALERAGHEVVDARSAGPAGCDVAVDFTRPDAVPGNVERCLEARVPVVIGTTGFDTDEVDGMRPGLSVILLGACPDRASAERVIRALPAELRRHAVARGLPGVTSPTACPTIGATEGCRKVA